ncbi:MAG: HAD family hydrolase [Bacteroidales bacterium]|nr:HAD family hydrolase [Bacteroidales bacterium]
MIKNIFFDFDGVIAESVYVKTEAFHQIYSPFGEDIARKVVEHHINNGGMSRFMKFKLYHDKFLNKNLNEQEIANFSERFSKLVKNKVINAPEVPGVRNFLKKYNKNMKFWIVSGTPTNEIREIIHKKKMDQFFKGIYGSPEVKTVITKQIIAQEGLRKDETIFLGDALSDYKAAKNTQINFALRNTIDNKNIFKKINILSFNDFYDFEKLLEEL